MSSEPRTGSDSRHTDLHFARETGKVSEVKNICLGGNEGENEVTKNQREASVDSSLWKITEVLVVLHLMLPGVTRSRTRRSQEGSAETRTP